MQKKKEVVYVICKPFEAPSLYMHDWYKYKQDADRNKPADKVIKAVESPWNNLEHLRE